MSSRESDAERIFLEAVESHAPAQWPDFLHEACGGNPTLRERVEALLGAHSESNSVLDAGGIVATIDQPVAARLGDTIGRYKLVELIGEGGFGAVYLAEQQEPVRRQVALKIIKLGMDTREVIARFEAERQALAVMGHPNIAKVHDAGATETGRPYFVMELVRGTPITEFCDNNTLTTKQRLALFIDVCQAIQHAHQKGIIHRDIKPSNVVVTLLDGKPIPKVIDFGIAKATQKQLTERTSLTRDGQFLGTPQYTSPEQAGMSDLYVDIRTDVYSLGVLLYELLVGTTPFDAQQLRQAGYDQICRIIRETDPPTPSKRMSTLGAATTEVCKQRRVQPAALRKLVRGDLDCIVMKALEKDRDDRYATAQALADDLRRHLENKPIRAKKPSLAQHASKWSRRHKPVVWSAVATLILGFVAFAASIVLIASAYEREKRQGARTQKALQLAEEQQQLAKRQHQLAEQQKDLAERNRKLAEDQKKEAIRQQQEVTRQRDSAYQNLYVAQMRLGYQDWHSGHIGRLKDLLDAHRPKKGQVDRRGWEWYYLLSLCHRDVLTLRGHIALVEAVAWRPTGGRVATASRDGTIKIWDVATGRELLTLRGHSSYALSVAWSPDGGRLLSGGRYGQVRVWDATAGKAVLKLRHGTGWICSVVWTPDGRQFASSSVQDGTVKVWDVNTGQEVLSLDDYLRQVWSLSISPDGRFLACAGESRSGEPPCITICNMKAGNKTATQPLQQDKWRVISTAWSPDGDRFAASQHVNCRVWDSKSWRPLFMTRGNAGTVHDVGFSPDGERLAAASVGGLVKVWGSANGKELATFRGHLDSVRSLSWSPDGKQLASASWDGTIKIWDSTADQEARTIPATSCACVDWSPPGNRLAVSDVEGEIGIYDAETGDKELTLRAELGDVLWLAWSPDGQQLAVGYKRDAIIKIWDMESQEAIRTLDGFPWGFPGAGQWSPDGSRLAASGWGEGNTWEEGSVKIWNPATGELIHSFTGNGPPMAWSPDGKRLVCGKFSPKERSSVTIVDALSAQVTLLLKDASRYSDRAARAACWSPDGRWIASGYRSGAVIVWESATGRKILRIDAHSTDVCSLDWSPDGKRLASAGFDSVAKIWDCSTGRELLTLGGHRAAIKTVKWSPDGRCLATASQDKSVRIWDASTGYELAAGPGYRQDRAYDLAASGRHKEAITLLEELSTEFPERHEYQLQLAHTLAVMAHTLAENDQHDEAIAVLQKQVADSPDVAEYRQELASLYFGRGDAPFHQGEYQKAFPDFEQAIRMNPEYSEAYDHRGQVYLARNELDKAIADFDEAIRFGPTYGAYTYANRGAAYLLKGAFDDAFADFSRAIDLEPTRARYWYYRALARLTRGDVRGYRGECASMLQQFGQAEDAGDVHWVAWTCALAPDAVADYSGVVALAKMAVESEPETISYRNTFGAILYRAGRLEEAIDQLAKVNERMEAPDQNLSSSPAYTWFFLAMAHHCLGHSGEAKKWLDKAVAWTDRVVAKRGNGTERSVRWNCQWTLQLLRKEAERLLESPGANQQESTRVEQGAEPTD